MLLRFLSSLQLTLGLLLGLALIAVLGTFQPAADGRYEVFYQSLWFRLLLGLLAVNLAACTWRTIRRQLGDLSRHLETLNSDTLLLPLPRKELPAGYDQATLETRLAQHGWRLRREGKALLAYRGRAGRWGSTAVHLSCLLIMAGALAAETGFVGTLNIYVGDKSAVYFDWDRQRDLPLGFEFRLDRFEPVYYPIELQFVARNPQTGDVIATYTTKEGDTVDLPSGLRAEVRRFFPLEEELVLAIYRNGNYLGDYHALGGGRSYPNQIDPGLDLRPIAFRDPILKQLHSEVSIIENGSVVRRGVIEVNQPLSHAGVAIYQTAFDRDKFGLYFAGFQFSRDPGEPLVWGGCIGLTIGLLLAFAVPFRVVGVTSGSEPQLVGLHGFRGEAGVGRFAELAESIAGGREMV